MLVIIKIIKGIKKSNILRLKNLNIEKGKEVKVKIYLMLIQKMMMKVIKMRKKIKLKVQ